jgi:hypothetical protein
LPVILLPRSALNGIHTHHEVPIYVFDFEYGNALVCLTAGSGFQVELMCVQWTNDAAVADQAFRQWPLTMRTAIGSRKDPAIALPEYGNLIITDDETAALSHWDGGKLIRVH